MRRFFVQRITGLAVGIAIALIPASWPAAAKTNWQGAELRDPLPQWALEAAKTPTPAIAKDAPAVVLFDEYLISVDAQNNAIERERYAVRILKPQGRKYAERGLEFDDDAKLDFFHAWTIGADGKQIEAQQSDFMDEGAYGDPVMQFSDKFRILTPPGNDPGSVVVCETERHLRPYMSEEEWEIQGSIPALNQSLELDLPPAGRYATTWHEYAPLQAQEVAPNHFRWEIKEMPGLDIEYIHATPEWGAMAARAAVKWGALAVEKNDEQWRAIGLWYEELFEHRADATPEIAAKAQELTAGAPDLYTKLSRITDYLQKNIRYFVVERGIGGWQPHFAADIYRNHYGDCKDKATLLIAMLKALGINAYPFHVDSERGVIDPSAPSLEGDHMITAIELPEGENDPRLQARAKDIQGKALLIFDPTDEETPLGLIRTELQGGYGCLMKGRDSQVLRMPVLGPESGGITRKGKLALGADGTLSGDISESFLGINASEERWFIKDTEVKKIREKLETGIAQDLPGLELKGFEFHQESDLDQPLNLDLHLGALNYAHASGPLLIMRPRLLGSHARNIPDVMEGKERVYPIEIGHPGHWRDEFEVKMPEGYGVDELPDAVDLDMDFASYHSKTTSSGSVLRYEREYVVRQVELPASRAADLRRLQSAIVVDENASAVLKKQ